MRPLDWLMTAGPLLVALTALLWLGGAPRAYQAAAQVAAGLPPLDRAQPAAYQTATFALG